MVLMHFVIFYILYFMGPIIIALLQAMIVILQDYDEKTRHHICALSSEHGSNCCGMC